MKFWVIFTIINAINGWGWLDDQLLFLEVNCEVLGAEDPFKQFEQYLKTEVLSILYQEQLFTDAEAWNDRKKFSKEGN